MDITQIVIIITLLSISACVVACGIWFILILRELRTTIIKTNNILDDTKLITASVSQPFTSFSEFILGFKNGISVFNSLFDKHKK
jgi:hypothetical protein